MDVSSIQAWRRVEIPGTVRFEHNEDLAEV
jgi:hypothetical protein